MTTHRLAEKLRRLGAGGLGAGGPTAVGLGGGNTGAAGLDAVGARAAPAASALPPSRAADAPARVEGGGRADRIERLRALVRETLARPRREPGSTPAALGPPPAASARLPGTRHDTPEGPLHVLDRFLEPHHHHGRVPIARALGVASGTLATLALDATLATLEPRRLLFLDTETTGLAGGTGTVPFLIGLAWFEDESLRLEQLLLGRLGEEAPMLRRLAERVEAASAVVTFNGKSFDWPLLRTRAVLARVPLPTPRAHLDLLHCARRVFGLRLEEGVRLAQVEAEVLGLCREHDVSGAEIPGLYFAFLRGAEGTALQPVLEHNALDLVALAALVARLGLHYERGAEGDDARDQLGYAGVADRAGDAEQAWRLARAAVEAGTLAPRHALRAHRLVATVARRRQDAEEERRALEASLALALEAGAAREAAAVHLALAKLHEHRTKQLALALVHAAHTAPAEGADAHARRVARLEQRLGRASASARAKGKGLFAEAEVQRVREADGRVPACAGVGGVEPRSSGKQRVTASSTAAND